MTAFVVSDVLGQKAGAYIATELLCRELARLGLKVTCFAQHDSGEGERSADQFEVMRPWLERGCRWDLPGKCLAWQARRELTRRKPAFVFVVGITRLARYLLRSEAADQLLVWETTNANPGNKFVDVQASRLLGRARAVLSPSNTIDVAVRSSYDYRGRLERLPFWIEDQHRNYTPAPTNFLADFIYLGRRDREKGIEELVRATAVVKETFPSVRVLVTGMGSEKPFAGLASEVGVGKNIGFQFFESREETMNALACSRALVLPSYHEGYPLVLLEAAQCSVPFIATRVGSVPELYENSPGAILVPPRDSMALAAAMKQMLSESGETYADRRAAAHQLFQLLSSAGTVQSRLGKVLRALEVST
jgi:glycosyltransferase involved in cell wall biosynthesis